MLAFASPTGTSAPRPVPAIQSGRGHLGDEILVFLALTILPLELPAAQPLRVPMALVVLAYMALHWRGVVGVVRCAPWAFMVPMACLLSAVWAADSLSALRHGAFLTFMLLTAALIAARLDLRQLAVVILLSQGALALASLSNLNPVWVGGADGGFGVLGVFTHKNVLGIRMVWIVIAALVVIFARGVAGPLKLIAAALLPVAVALALLSKSATAVILLIGAVPLVLVGAAVWPGGARVRGAMPAVLLSGLAVASFAGLLAVNTVVSDPAQQFLEAFGKDRTLTGRTEIWSVAEESLAENPVLGVGAANFWQADNYAAARIASRFQDATAERFSFHSLPIELAVHLGIFGLIVGVLTYGRGVWLMVTAWRRRPTAVTALCLGFGGVFVVRIATESVLFAPMNLDGLLFWVMTFSAALTVSISPPSQSAAP